MTKKSNFFYTNLNSGKILKLFFEKCTFCTNGKYGPHLAPFGDRLYAKNNNGTYMYSKQVAFNILHQI
jgi:hypothetical protein